MKNSGGIAKTQTTFSARKIEELSECKDRNCLRFWKMVRVSLIYLSELTDYSESHGSTLLGLSLARKL